MVRHFARHYVVILSLTEDPVIISERELFALPHSSKSRRKSSHGSLRAEDCLNEAYAE